MKNPLTHGTATAIAILLLQSTGLLAQPQIAFTQSNPLFFAQSQDALRTGAAGGPYADVPLPGGSNPLEFPWDVDYANGRLYVVGAGQDSGTSPPNREFNADGLGTIWSMRLDGSGAQLHASGLNRPLHLDVTPDGSAIYFSEQGSGEGATFGNNGRVARIDTATNTIETVVNAPDNAGPTGVTYDSATDTLFYQANNRGTDTTMQEIRRVANAGSATNLTEGADELFLTNPVPPGGFSDPVDGTEFPVVSAGRNIEIFNNFIYFTYRNGAFDPDSEIRRIPLSFDLATGDPQTFETIIGSDFGGVRIIDFEIDGDTLFFTDAQQNGLFSVALDENGLTEGAATRIATGETDFSALPIGVAVVPEPGTFALLLGCGAFLAVLVRRRKR